MPAAAARPNPPCGIFPALAATHAPRTRDTSTVIDQPASPALDVGLIFEKRRLQLCPRIYVLAWLRQIGPERSESFRRYYSACRIGLRLETTGASSEVVEVAFCTDTCSE